MGILCFFVMTGLALFMRQRPPVTAAPVTVAGAPAPGALPFGFSPTTAQVLLCIAGLACCVAMSMPQVHIVAYCGDLGYGAARGAEMLSLMLACGIVSRLVSGAICDRIGGLRTLLLGSMLQCVALLLFLPFNGLVSLYVIAALFGLFQGGIVPSYAIIVREHFPPAEAGARVGAVIMCTMFGMALGGWMSGRIFDITGSYRAAFINGIAWNLLNLAIALVLLRRVQRGDAKKRSGTEPPASLIAKTGRARLAVVKLQCTACRSSGAAVLTRVVHFPVASRARNAIGIPLAASCRWILTCAE
jgi:MFS family permease